jgi:hypothetical protein
MILLNDFNNHQASLRRRPWLMISVQEELLATTRTNGTIYIFIFTAPMMIRDVPDCSDAAPID